MTKIQWGILGPGDIAQNFANGLAQAPSGELRAIASRSAARRESFGDAYAIAADKRYDSYAKLIADPEIDAVYISTPHPFHAQLAIDALRGGKNVLCEKPAGLSMGEVTAMTEIAAQQGVLFMEAYMYRCHPQISFLIEQLKAGVIGDIQHVAARFGFAASFDPTSRLFDRELAGGAILDVGGYPLSFARLVAGVAAGKPFDNPVSLEGVARMTPSGVDSEAHAVLKFASGVTATCATAVERNMTNIATIIGSKGEITMQDPWAPGRDAGPSDAFITISTAEGERAEALRYEQQLFSFEAEVASEAIAAGLTEAPWPAMGWADSIGNADALDRWRAAVGYQLPIEGPTGTRILTGVMPTDLPAMPMREVAGVSNAISALVMGCDNRDTVAEGAIVWDAWVDAGGNAFDTGFVYGDGLHEAVLGQWMAARGVADEMTVIVKGAHSPYCTPRALAAQLEISLDRLQLDQAPIYIMHRDNPDVPVGEFVDVLNQLKEAGKIGIFGGSNWGVDRFSEARRYAENANLTGPSVLNNNLSLAVMEKPVWAGCVSSNNPATLTYLRENNLAHFSWSSQARGYFLPKELRDRLPVDTRPETCFGSEANAERRRRAAELAAKYGVSAHNIATAWVLHQQFPSFALIGPRTPGEIASTFPALPVSLSAEEVTWLNLE